MYTQVLGVSIINATAGNLCTLKYELKKTDCNKVKLDMLSLIAIKFSNTKL